jgi:tRNA-Thr(GGU) m(6)t(6)A37 methyltransferase TsaA
LTNNPQSQIRKRNNIMTQEPRMREFTIKHIGYIRSEHKDAENTPCQPVFAPECKGQVEVFPEFTEGLKDIEGFSHIIILYWFHEAKSTPLFVKPFLDDIKHGIFATRVPGRPNPIGLSIVRLLKHEENVLHIQGVDVLDGTPLLDIKPYSSRFDCFPDCCNGWQEKIDEPTARQRGVRGYNSANRDVTDR